MFFFFNNLYKLLNSFNINLINIKFILKLSIKLLNSLLVHNELLNIFMKNSKVIC